jgi:hypothetical protein
MNAKGNISTGDLRLQILKTLSTNRWQNAGLISCQVTIPPDAIAREATRLKKSESSAKSALCAMKLNALRKSNSCEYRKDESGRFEYRANDKTTETIAKLEAK